MILVSGTRGPGFNSRIAPIFTRPQYIIFAILFITCLFIIIYWDTCDYCSLRDITFWINRIDYQMSKSFFSTECPSEQVQQIIRLRVELTKNIAKVELCDELIAKNKQNQDYINQINVLVKNLSTRVEDYSRKIIELARILQIPIDHYQTFPNNFPRMEHSSTTHQKSITPRLGSKGQTSRVKIYELSDSLSPIRQTEMSKKNSTKSVSFRNFEQPNWQQNEYSGLNKEEMVYNMIVQKTIYIMKEIEGFDQKINHLNHSSMRIKEIQDMTNQQEGKVRQLQIFLQQKDIIIQDFQAQINKNRSLILSYEAKIRQLQAVQRQLNQQLNSRILENQKIRDDLRVSCEGNNRLKIQGAAQNCENLLKILQRREEDYLKHYFTSNGVYLQTQQKSLKNKYNMVFDTA